MKGFQVDWNEFKAFVNDRNLSIQWLDWRGKYWMKAFDGAFELECVVDKVDTPADGSDQKDFEDNYKANGNKKLEAKNPTDAAMQVAIVEAEGSSNTLITHDWADNTTWMNGTGDSTWVLEPQQNQILFLKKAEVQFSHDVVLNGQTKLRFDTWVYNPLFDPQQPIDPDDDTFVPGVSQGNPLRFLYDRSEYTSIKDVLNYGNDHFTMPAVDGMANSITTVQFNYARAIVLKHSQGAQIRINLENNTPMLGEFCTISLIVREEDE